MYPIAVIFFIVSLKKISKHVDLGFCTALHILYCTALHIWYCTAAFPASLPARFVTQTVLLFPSRGALKNGNRMHWSEKQCDLGFFSSTGSKLFPFFETTGTSMGLLCE